MKNLFETPVKEEMIGRINDLRPDTKALWGKMNVSQMLAHCQVPLAVALGTHPVPRRFMGRIFGGMAKKMLLSQRPVPRSLPTDPAFKMTDTRVFEDEKSRLVSMIREFSGGTLQKDVHPFFGRMTAEEWATTMWKHIDHHLRQFGV